MATESITGTRGLSVRERRQRNREEMRAGILAIAREIMREQGIAALNLNEIARRVGITPPALYTYFPSKMALYDELYRMGIRLLCEAEEALQAMTTPGWGRIEAWFAQRLALAEEHPDLYHLVFDVPVPGFVPTPESLAEVRRLYEATVRGIAEVIAAGALRPDLAPEQATDLLLAMRLGIVAAHVGRQRLLPPPARVARLVPEIVAVLRAAWEPADGGPRTGRTGEKGRGAMATGDDPAIGDVLPPGDGKAVPAPFAGTAVATKSERPRKRGRITVTAERRTGARPLGRTREVRARRSVGHVQR